MALPVIANAVRVSVYGTVEGGVGWSNTFHIGTTNPETYAAAIPKMQTSVAKLYSINGYGSGMRGWGSFNTDGSTTSQVVYTPLDGITASTTYTMVIPGASTQEPLPPQNAISCTINTGYRGRAFRGRVYWTASSREILSGAKVSQANIDSINACWKAFNDELIANTPDLYLSVGSYSTDAILPALVSNPVSAHAVLAHQQGRRGRGA